MKSAELSNVALITGSSSGIGEATARHFAKQGYKVVVTGRDEARGKAVEQSIIAAGGQAAFYPAELSRESDAESLAAYAANLGRLSVLVHCAGSNKPGMTFEDHIATNYKAPVFATRAALGHMSAGASIVMVTSICSESKRHHGGGPYADMKAATTSFVHGIAGELLSKGIRINIVAPGFTDTRDTQHTSPKDRADNIARMPLVNDFLDPAEVAQTIYDVSMWRAVTGQTVIIDGGMTTCGE